MNEIEFIALCKKDIHQAIRVVSDGDPDDLILSQSSDGTTILHYTVLSGNPEITKTVIDLGANLFAMNNVGTPYDLAIYLKNRDIIKVFLDTPSIEVSRQNLDAMMFTGNIDFMLRRCVPNPMRRDLLEKYPGGCILCHTASTAVMGGDHHTLDVAISLHSQSEITCDLTDPATRVTALSKMLFQLVVFHPVPQAEKCIDVLLAYGADPLFPVAEYGRSTNTVTKIMEIGDSLHECTIIKLLTMCTTMSEETMSEETMHRLAVDAFRFHLVRVFAFLISQGMSATVTSIIDASLCKTITLYNADSTTKFIVFSIVCGVSDEKFTMFDMVTSRSDVNFMLDCVSNYEDKPKLNNFQRLIDHLSTHHQRVTLFDMVMLKSFKSTI